jgi:glyoxylase-like metal-dependent hydrolase (beta-lactamase superfamily II)
MQIELLVLCCHQMGGMEMNCLLVSEGPAATELIVVDPGDEPERILAAAHGRQIKGIVATHCHPDHIGGLHRLVEISNAEVWAHRLDAPRIADPSPGRAGMGQIDGNNQVDHLLEEGALVPVGAGHLTVLHTPGHTVGSICLYDELGGNLIAGDTLFRATCGRTDFPGGSDEQMRESLKRLATLPDETIVYPGHDEQTSIGWEKRSGILRSLVS